MLPLSISRPRNAVQIQQKPFVQQVAIKALAGCNAATYAGEMDAQVGLFEHIEDCSSASARLAPL
jgi:hypothetical protein